VIHLSKKNNATGIAVATTIISATLIPFLFSLVKLIGKK